MALFLKGDRKMNRSNNYRLLQLQNILFEETDDDNELGLEELREKLQKTLPNRMIDDRTIRKDLRTLDEAGFEIVKNKGKFGKNLYSHQARTFEVYQLRLIVDAILSARFITNNEKTNLIDRLKQLTSKHMAKNLPEPMVFSQSINMDYEQVKLNIDRVHKAVSERRVVAYQYGRYNVDKKFELGRDGSFYYVEPYGLIWQKDFYYLIGRYQPKNELRHYRLDRIRNIKLTDERFSRGNFQLQEYVDRTFHMFAGKETRIKIQFHNDIITVVFDRFGQDVDIQKVDDDHFILSTRAKLSDGLINWILTWGNQAKVLSPDHLVEQMKEKIQQMKDVYLT